jgi:hypothetical protein
MAKRPSVFFFFGFCTLLPLVVIGRVKDVPYPPLRATNRRDVESRSTGLESSEARQKFAGAKAISSDMFFGREVDTEVSKSFLPAWALGFSTSLAWPI